MAKTNSREEERMVRRLDELAQYEEFCTNILPQLRKDIAQGLTAEQIYAKYSHLAAARGISIALAEADSSKSLAAIKEILDRTQGKAIERHAVQHKFEKLKDEELDALLVSRAREVGDETED